MKEEAATTRTDEPAAITTGFVHGRAGSETSAAMRGLFGRDSIYVGLWGLQLGFSALITPVATRLLSSESYGRTMAATAVMQVLVAVGSLSLQAAVQRQYAHQDDGPRQARRLVTLAIIVSLATFVVADLTGPAWSSLLRLEPYDGAVRYAVAWAAMTAISNAALGWIRSRDRLRAFAAVSLLQSVGAALLSLALIVLVRRTASEFILGELLAQVAAVLVALLVTRPLRIRRADLTMVRRGLAFASVLAPAAVAGLALDSADRLIIQHGLGSTAVARYSVAYNIGAIPVILLAVLDSSWWPRMFALSRGARSAVMSQSRNAIYALLIPTMIGISAGTPFALAAWVPPRYHPGGLLLVVALLSVSSLPIAGGLAATRVLLVAGATRSIASRTVVASGLTVALTVALVSALKLNGAALATLLGFALLHALLARAAGAVQPLARPPLSLVAKCLAAALIAVGLTQLPTGVPFLTLRALIALACLALFASLLCDLIAPRRFPRVSLIASRVHLVPGDD